MSLEREQPQKEMRNSVSEEEEEDEEAEEERSRQKCLSNAAQLEIKNIIDIPVINQLDPTLNNNFNNNNLNNNNFNNSNLNNNNYASNNHHANSNQHPHYSQHQQQQHQLSSLSHSLISHPSASNALTAEMIEQSLTPYRVGKNWACRICGRQFTRRFNCTTHERTHLDLRERAQFQCGLCERAFTRRHDLERHVHSVHPGHTLERGTNRMMTPQIVSHTSSDQNQLQALSPRNHQLQIRSLADQQSMLSHSTSSDHLRNAEQVRILVIDPSSINHNDQKQDTILIPSPTTSAMSLSGQTNSLMTGASTSIQIHGSNNPGIAQQPTAILTSGSIREVSQAVERVPLDQISRFNPNQDAIFNYGRKWACGTCGRIFVRRNNCKAHEATHRDIREHQCSTCSRSFSRKHDLERHILAVHPGIDLFEGGTGSTSRGGYESSDLTSSRKKRKKQQGANKSEDWVAIDPMILTLDLHQQQQQQMDHRKSTKPHKKNQDQTGRITNLDNNDDGDDDEGNDMNELRDENVNDNRTRRSGGSVRRTTQVKSKMNSTGLEHISHQSSSSGNHHTNTIHSFNIFETFDPNPTIQSMNDSNDTQHLDSLHLIKSHLSFMGPILPSSPDPHPSPPPSDSNLPIQLDPRLFS